MKAFIATSLLVCSMGVGLPLAHAQTGAQTEAQKAGESTKDAGKDAADVAKHAGRAAAKGTKKGARKVKKAVTGDAHATCVDGSVQAGTTEAAAASGCVSHGGVAKH